MKGTIFIPEIKSEEEIILNIRVMIDKEYQKLFQAVIVHGSFATDDRTLFSDFDGLLIVHDKYMKHKELNHFISKSLEEIYRFDPLQHHGWFVISVSSLLQYPEEYLPIAVLKEAKCIYPIEGCELRYVQKTRINYLKIADKYIEALIKRVNRPWQPRNIYQLKSFLSQVMLLPSLLYAAINNRGIYKRDSFVPIQALFTEQEWSPIVIASHIRENWDYSLNVFQRYMMKRPGRVFRKMTQHWIAPSIDPKTKLLLNDEFYYNLSILLNKSKALLHDIM